MNVALEMSSLRVIAKRSRGKKQQKETETQQHFIVTENNLFKILLQKMFKISTRNSPVSLVAASHGISHAVEDCCPVDPQCHLPSLSSLSDYFRS